MKFYFVFQRVSHQMVVETQNLAFPIVKQYQLLAKRRKILRLYIANELSSSGLFSSNSHKIRGGQGALMIPKSEISRGNTNAPALSDTPS